MANQLEQLEQQLNNQSGLPPIERWTPELSGDIDIVIRRNGEWWHEGSPIRRLPLVKLFASILRREEDGEHYLVTPVEKWRIQVEDTPLLIVDFEIKHAGHRDQSVIVSSNVQRQYLLGETYPMLVPDASDTDSEQQAVPIVELDNGLQARFDRPVYYRLVEAAEQQDEHLTLLSEGKQFTVGYL